MSVYTRIIYRSYPVIIFDPEPCKVRCGCYTNHHRTIWECIWLRLWSQVNMYQQRFYQNVWQRRQTERHTDRRRPGKEGEVDWRDNGTFGWEIKQHTGGWKTKLGESKGRPRRRNRKQKGIFNVKREWERLLKVRGEEMGKEKEINDGSWGEKSKTEKWKAAEDFLQKEHFTELGHTCTAHNRLVIILLLYCCLLTIIEVQSMCITLQTEKTRFPTY